MSRVRCRPLPGPAQEREREVELEKRLAPMRKELGELKLIALMKRAESDGVPDEVLEIAETKEDFIAAIVAHAKPLVAIALAAVRACGAIQSI